MNCKVTTSLFFILFILLSFLFSCSEADKKIKETVRKPFNSELDSLVKWIAASKSANLKLEEKKVLLSNAFDLVQTWPEDTVKMKQLSEISYAASEAKDSSFFRRLNTEAIILSQKLNDTIAFAEAQWDKAIFFNSINVKDSAFYYYNETSSLYNNLKMPTMVGQLYYNIGVVQREVGDYAGAEASTIKAMEIFKELENFRWLSMAYNSLGAITSSLGNYEQAIEFYQTADEYLENDKDNKVAKAEIINNIGVAYESLGQFKNAEKNFEKVLEMDSLRLIEPEFYAKGLTNLANARLKLTTKDNLVSLYKEAISIQKKLENKYNEATSSGYLANYLAYKKDTVNAISQAKKARELAHQSENTQSLLRTLNLLTKIDLKNASTYAQEYIAISEKMQLEERQLRDKFARIRFQTDEVLEKNQLLAQQNELLKREKLLWSALAIIGFLGIIAVFIIFIQHIKNKNLRFKQQEQESNQEIFNLLMLQQGKIAEGKKATQQRISQELHDGVVASLMGIRLVLISLNKNSDEASIASRAALLKDLQAVSEEIRAVSHELSSAAYDKVYNFMESVKELVTKFKAATDGIDYQLVYQKRFNWDTINNDIKINLYRILQESLQNAVKHAKPNSIFINFDVIDNAIVTRIEDDGNGFDPKKIKKGIGFKNIKARLKNLDGKWEIESNLGKGTKTIIKIPLKTHLAA